MSREAMQMALDALESLQAWPETPENFKRFRAIEALRARLAQPDVPETAFGETEPVAWMHNFIDDVIIKNRPTDITCNAGRWTALYTAPPQREWVGLTDEEYEAMAEHYVTNCYFDTLEYARAIEAKLKEKNS
jgi:hypothetical protein